MILPSMPLNWVVSVCPNSPTNPPNALIYQGYPEIYRTYIYRCHDLTTSCESDAHEYPLEMLVYGRVWFSEAFSLQQLDSTIISHPSGQISKQQQLFPRGALLFNLPVTVSTKSPKHWCVSDSNLAPEHGPMVQPSLAQTLPTESAPEMLKPTKALHLHQPPRRIGAGKTG